MTIHKLFCGRIFGRHPHFQQKLGRALTTHSIGPQHSSTTPFVCQFKEVFIWNDRIPIPWLHYKQAWGVYGSCQDPSHS